MQPDTLHNQLRFNLSEPYSLNKLAVRHQRPQPIVIEKADPSTSYIKSTAQGETSRAEVELIDKFNTLNLERMRQAQFLAQRQIKKEKSEKLMKSLNVGKKNQHDLSPIRTIKLVNPKKQLAKQPRKKTPTKSRSRMPVFGNSPPVRDTQFTTRETAPVRLERNISQDPPPSTKRQFGSTYSHTTTAAGPTKSATRGITREKLDDNSAFSMPDLHKMAIDQLIRIQQGEYIPSPSSRKKKTSAKAVKSVNKSALSPARARFLRPSVRAEAGRIVRERIYRQQLHHPLPTPQKVSLSEQQRRQLGTNSKDQSLPDPDDFIERVMEARRQRELTERLSVNPSRMVDDIEKEARKRLEPLIRQAQKLSQNMAYTAKTTRPSIYQIDPQYDTSHELGRMSADELVYHPVENRNERTSNKATHAYPDDPPSTSESQSEKQSDITTDDVSIIRNMLAKLDKMEQEQIQIRQRWMTACNQYDDLGLVSLDDGPSDEPRDIIMEGPKPMVLSRAQSQCPKTTTYLSSDLKAGSPNGNRMTEDGFGRTTVSLTEKTIRSIENGKKRFEKHLDSICHSASKDFNPWKFAQDTADSIVDRCLLQVAQEIINSGNDLIQDLYTDEFIAAAHIPTSPLAVSPS